MIEIRHKTTRAVLLRAAVDTLNGKNLTGLNLAQADLSGVSMTYACFCKATLRLADLTGALLTSASLDSANLELANLTKADLASATLLGAQLRGANLTGACLRYAQLAGADLHEANLENADLSMADLRANLRDAILVRADLRGANLAGANLQYANLTGADLTSANLEGAKLLGAKLQGAKLDRGMQASARAVMSAPGMFSRKTEPKQAKAPLNLDFNSFGLASTSRPVAGRSAPPAETPARRSEPAADTSGGADRLARWRNCLRVRYLGGAGSNSLAIQPGAEGVVLEFCGPLGNDYWQVQFAALGAFYIHREEVEVLDHDFLADAAWQQDSEDNGLLQGAKETVVYSTNGGKFKSLIIWYSEKRYLAVEEVRKAEKLIRLCKQRRIRVTRDRWFD